LLNIADLDQNHARNGYFRENPRHHAREHRSPWCRPRPLRHCDPARAAARRAPVQRRARLAQQGFITGYRAEIDRRKIGLGVLAFVRIDADRNTAAATRELEEAIRRIPEVIACHYISGSGTFELQVMATDLDAFSRFALDVLLNLPHVKDLHTSFSLGEVKSGGALPLGHLRGAAEAGGTAR
jgi:Lrp/AsnC family transcriptional regulator, leucine-responsive regulatory protein